MSTVRRTPRQAIRDISKSTVRQRIHHGRLAENYDGIGQHVLVSLSQSSTSAAYRAKVAAGDFGTGQVIPVGTKVSVISIRGQLEIVSMGAK
jgi:hypothetical protein